MSPKLKPWLVLAVIFIAGVLTGVALNVALSSHSNKPPGQHDFGKSIMTKITERLKLTPDQVTKIQPIIEDTAAKVRALHHEEMQRGADIFKANDDAIAAFLTPDQKAELQKMREEREKMFASHHHHDGLDDGGGPPPPTPLPPPPTGSTTPPPAQ